MKRIRVILVADGDSNARAVIELLAGELGLRCISASAGNPTPLGGDEIVTLVKQTPHDPVLILFDDRGNPGQGKGESAMKYVATHPDITVLGALAVASGAAATGGARVDFSIDREARIVASVDKFGRCGRNTSRPIVHGDTLGVLNTLNLPIIIGIGDIGKMGQADAIACGAPITRKAIMEILKVSDVLNDSRTENRQRP